MKKEFFKMKINHGPKSFCNMPGCKLEARMNKEGKSWCPEHYHEANEYSNLRPDKTKMYSLKVAGTVERILCYEHSDPVIKEANAAGRAVSFKTINDGFCEYCEPHVKFDCTGCGAENKIKIRDVKGAYNNKEKN